MAMRPVCDVYGTAKEVKSYTVAVTVSDGDKDVVQLKREADLCPRALKRLEGFVLRGLNPASRTNGKVVCDGEK